MNLDKLKELASNPELEASLERARTMPPMTAAQLFEQRVSWVYGQLGSRSNLSKDEVRSALSRLNGGQE